MARRGISCLKCGGLGHIQRMCLENTKSVDIDEVSEVTMPLPVTEVAAQPSRPELVRVQRVVVQSAEAARKMATDRGDQVAAEVAQGEAIRQAVGEMAKPATGDKAKPTAGHVDPAGVTVADRRNSASGCYITATDRRCRASDYGVTSENLRKCATEYGVAAGDRRGGGASGYRVASDKRREDEFRRPLSVVLKGGDPLVLAAGSGPSVGN
ncbi:hypothetical protein DPMN_074697 [Dreissena polymorpha]|uniref:CCHC-type domain-containing protein n=1 Tax=Dreissena polymorpha TaxID=45954 RepID=A0A9D4BLY2_DREPO|nr:hypothetical protein DPMN_074697 [Dreissena polymorpha]